MKRILGPFWALTAIAGFTLAGGCADKTDPAPSSTGSTHADDHKHGEGGHEHGEGGHSHGAGPHDGTLADWGGGKYHVEFTVDHDKKEATIYVLGGDEKTPSPIKATDGKLLLTIAQPAIQAELKAVPQEGDPEGTSSRFVGTHDNLGIVQEYAGTISGAVEGTPYAGDFKEEPHTH